MKRDHAVTTEDLTRTIYEMESTIEVKKDRLKELDRKIRILS